ncbi:hypothetical protein Ahia01_000468600 [Argonauta hians]
MEDSKLVLMRMWSEIFRFSFFRTDADEDNDKNGDEDAGDLGAGGDATEHSRMSLVGGHVGTEVTGLELASLLLLLPSFAVETSSANNGEFLVSGLPED